MNTPYITQFDKVRLIKLLDKKLPGDDWVKTLRERFQNSMLVKPKDVPANVITMNSEIRFSDEYGDDWEFRLVFPEEADLTQSKLSVSSPIGSALLGRKVKDKITLDTPMGKKNLIIEEIIYQPERAGNFDL